MKSSKLFRILGIVITLSLLVIAIPVTPVLAQSIYCSPSTGAPGTTVTVTGSAFTAYANTYVYIFFDSTYQTSTPVNVYGNLSTSFVVPSSATTGTHYITVDNSPAYDGVGIATTNFSVTEHEITVSPTSGYVGDQITVSSSGFSASSSVTIYFDTTVLGTTTTNIYGNFTATYTVPERYRGSHTIKAQDASGYYASTTFTVLPEITITPTSGAVGDTVTINGTGFTAYSGITFYFDNVSAGNTTTNANGSFTGSTFTIPSSSPGSRTVKAQDASGYYATALFAIATNITITPTTGASGTTVTVTGTGFRPSKTITIKYNGVPVTTSPTIINTDATGNFTASFKVLAGLAGNYSVEATDGTYSDSANFVATADVTFSQTTSEASPGYVGMELTIRGTGFKPIATVTITYASAPVVLATITTDGNGAFSTAVTIPPSTGGNHSIIVTDGYTSKQYNFVMESKAPPVPELLLPEKDTKTKAETYFDWDDVDDPSGVSYTLQIATDSKFTSVSIILKKEGLTDSEYTLTEEEKLESVKKDEPYYWRVRAIDGASNNSAWPEPVSFYVGFQWPTIQGALLYALLGIVAVLFLVLGFWLGRRTAAY